MIRKGRSIAAAFCCVKNPRKARTAFACQIPVYGGMYMNITSKLNLDLMKPKQLTPVKMMQDDRYTRSLELTLYADGEAWPVPENVNVMIRYVKPDGTGGEYDVLPNGTAAWTARDHVLTIEVAPQVLTASG